MSFGTSSQEQEQSSSSGMNKAFMPYAKAALNRAAQVGDQGYTPYMGMDVAVPDSQINSWQQVADRSAAFNTPGQAAQDVRSQMPLTTQNGVQGLSSYAGYQDQLAQLQQNYPGLYDYIKSFAIDPVTGKPGSRTFAANPIKSGGGGGGGAGGAMPKFTLQQRIQQGVDSGGGLGGMMAFMGLPYSTRAAAGMPMKKTSAYKELYDNAILTGGRPAGV